MLIDAVFPAASELVMVYGGALASGALDASLRRLRLARDRASPRTSRSCSRASSATSSARSSAGGSAIRGGRAVPRAPRPLVPPDARRSSTAPSAGSSAGTRGPSCSGGSRRSHARSSRSPPASSRARSPRYNLFTLLGNAVWCLVLAGDRLGARLELDDLPPRLPLRRDTPSWRGIVGGRGVSCSRAPPPGYHCTPRNGDPPR